MPTHILRQWELVDMDILALLSEADRELGRLDMFSEYVPDIDLFIRMHVTKEAAKSSEIEGTRTTVEEVFMDQARFSSEQRRDKEEVENYIRAQEKALALMQDIPLSSRVLRSAHAELMQGVRGENKQPGHFRKSQNWIGGATISDAAFVPPVHKEITGLMADLEKFLHDERHPMPYLIKVAIAHYQFETIHPFLDGNGRVGRLLIPLYLVEKDVLKRPVLYLSDYLEKHRRLYYDHLEGTRVKSDLRPWLRFFLVGIIDSARSGIDAFDTILKLKEECEAKTETLGKKAKTAQNLLRGLYIKPVMNAQEVMTICDLSAPAANRLIADMERLGILEEMTGMKRNREWRFKEYLAIFSS